MRFFISDQNRFILMYGNVRIRLHLYANLHCLVYVPFIYVIDLFYAYHGMFYEYFILLVN